MAMDDRSGVLSGEQIALRALMTDDNGFPRSTDVLPSVYIYSSSTSTVTIEAELDAGIFTSAVAGPLTPTLISTGYYGLNYTVPSGAVEGTWTDVWVGDIDTEDVSGILSFRVLVGGSFAVQSLSNNQMVILELDGSIGSDTTDQTLTSDVMLSFSTTFSPYYSSVELVRMEAGPLIEYIPDDTIALMIHWSSKEADLISRGVKKCGESFLFARTKFIACDTSLKALTLPGGKFMNGLDTGGDTKTLGELSITKGLTGANNTLSGGIDLETYNAIKKLRDEWWRVVNAGGCINPGQSLGFEAGLRGLYDPARKARQAGRLWMSPDQVHYEQPTSNTKIRKAGERLNRHGYTRIRPRHRSLTRRLNPDSIGVRYYDD